MNFDPVLYVHIELRIAINLKLPSIILIEGNSKF